VKTGALRRTVSVLLFGENYGSEKGHLVSFFSENCGPEKGCFVFYFFQPSSGLAMLMISGGASCGVTSKADVHS
jgi:hypothetical protein